MWKHGVKPAGEPWLATVLWHTSIRFSEIHLLVRFHMLFFFSRVFSLFFLSYLQIFNSSSQNWVVWLFPCFLCKWKDVTAVRVIGLWQLLPCLLVLLFVIGSLSLQIPPQNLLSLWQFPPVAPSFEGSCQRREIILFISKLL